MALEFPWRERTGQDSWGEQENEGSSGEGQKGMQFVGSDNQQEFIKKILKL